MKPAARHPRPIRTEYSYPSFNWQGSSRSSSLKGALRAAVVRIVAGEFSSAKIFDELNLLVYAVVRKGKRITIIAKDI